MEVLTPKCDMIGTKPPERHLYASRDASFDELIVRIGRAPCREKKLEKIQKIVVYSAYSPSQPSMHWLTHHTISFSMAGVLADLIN